MTCCNGNVSFKQFFIRDNMEVVLDKWAKKMSLIKFNDFKKQYEIVAEGKYDSGINQTERILFENLGLRIIKSKCNFHHWCDFYVLINKDGEKIETYHERIHKVNIRYS